MWNQSGYCNHIPHAGYPFYHAPCSHNQRTTTFRHPVSGQISAENMDFILHEPAQGTRIMSKPVLEQLSSTTVSEASTAITSSTVDTNPASKGSRSIGKVHSFGKREQAIKRNPNVPVVVRGWLYKQDSSGMRLWKRKWFVLADFCLFYYKDSREESVLGSIPLPSYVISPVGPEDHISRKYAFKASYTGMRSYIYKQSSVIGSQAEHSGMRTYYFSADTHEDMNTWLRAMNQAALMQNHSDALIRPPSRENTLPRRTPPTQHKFTTMDSYQSLPRQSPPPGRLGEYKYAQDRMSHFRLTPEQSGPASNTVWQLYEWQQRHQFRHGSPTAPLYTPAPEYPFGPRPPSTVPPSTSASASRPDGAPRCVSVPPSSADIPPPGPPPGASRTLSPTRRPHTPADRVTVRPIGDRSVMDIPFSVSPRRTKSQLFKAATIERRSMPPSGYITHTVSAPSLHGKTTDDTYMQLKKDLEYLDLKVAGSQTLKDLGKPVKVAESDVDVKLSRLCEQDKILKDLEVKISSLKDDKDKLESVLDVSHQQMEQFHEQPAHAHKIAYQQRLLQEDLVTIRAQISRLSTEMAQSWDEYNRLERSVEQLRSALHAHMNNSATSQQDKAEMKRELWRIEDVMAGLSASKANYKITIDSVQNPERKLVPSVSDPSVPSHSTEVQPPPRSSIPNIRSHTLPHSIVPKWAEDSAPPRPPLPRLYDYEETPPVVPPLPKEASVIRHTSVRGLKRQSDERKRDRESGQYVVNGDCKPDLRSYLSEPELPGVSHHNAGSDVDYQYLPGKGLSGSSSQLNQSNISSYVTLRRGHGSSVTRERPKSALERLSSPTENAPLPSSHQRGRMTAEEQLERMKRHQKALVRERKRNLSQGERSSASTATTHRSSSSSRLPSNTSDPPASVFDWQEERMAAEGQSDEGRNRVRERGRFYSDEWTTATATKIREVDVEPLEYDLDISRELSKPQKVSIPERYVETDSDEPTSPEELEERSKRAERIRSLLAKSSVQNIHPSAPLDFSELDSALQQQERIMNVSQALASEASRKSKLVAAKAAAEH